MLTGAYWWVAVGSLWGPTIFLEIHFLIFCARCQILALRNKYKYEYDTAGEEGISRCVRGVREKEKPERALAVYNGLVLFL